MKYFFIFLRSKLIFLFSLPFPVSFQLRKLYFRYSLLNFLLFEYYLFLQAKNLKITNNFLIGGEATFQIKNSNLFSSLLFLDENGILGKIPFNEIIEKIQLNNSIIKNSKIFINSEEFADKNFVGNILIRESEVI